MRAGFRPLPTFTVLRIEGTGSVFTGVQRAQYPDGSEWHVILIGEMRDGQGMANADVLRAEIRTAGLAIAMGRGDLVVLRPPAFSDACDDLAHLSSTGPRLTDGHAKVEMLSVVGSRPETSSAPDRHLM